MERVEQNRGVVVAVDDKYIWVNVQQLSACNGCHAKDFCCSTDCKDRLIRLRKGQKEKIEIGDVVAIEASDMVGIKAVVIAFIIPILLIVFSVVICNTKTQNQLILALVVLAVLIIYFMIIWMLKKPIAKMVKLYHKKITNDLQ